MLGLYPLQVWSQYNFAQGATLFQSAQGPLLDHGPVV